MATLSKMHIRVLKGRTNNVGPYKLAVDSSMAFVQPDKPELKADKGKRAGSCNRTACQKPGAYWWNRGSYSWYCTTCAHMLNTANRSDPFCADEPLCRLDEDARSDYYFGLEAMA